MSDTAIDDLDACVEAFELVLARDGRADLEDFLPAPAHPRRRDILLELVRVDLEWGWSKEHPTSLDAYQRRFPELFTDPDALQAITFEEFRLRRQAGQTPRAEEYATRYGVNTADWPQPAASEEGMLEQAALAYQEYSRLAPTRRGDINAWCQSFRGNPTAARVFRDLHATDPVSAQRIAEAVVVLPEQGDIFLDFHLEEELGRGAFGRVFLARQDALAGRRVALKLTPDVGGESQTLAQLQHTHIVPIYSVHRAGPLQAICMPYFGRTTLADVLRDLASRPGRPKSGAELLSSVPRRAESTLTDAGEPVDLSTEPTAVALRGLEGRSYTEGVLWLGACLADGLAHAHDRGILHRDLKPANVLLTDEGLPMLLDFNLSEDVKLRSTASVAVVGGTLPYMAPEQLEAFSGSQRSLDGRTDLFALGILLYELLAGRPPFPRAGNGAKMPANELIREMLRLRSQPPVPVSRWNRAVSPAVDAMIAKCLHPDPNQRYATAQQLHEDLQRQLEHRPLKHIPDPSWRERAQKWIRSNPRVLGRLAMVAASLALLTAVILGVRSWSLAQTRDSLTALQAFRDDCKAVHDILTAQADDRERADEALAIGRRALDRFRVLDEPRPTATASLQALPVAERERFQREAGELLLLLANGTAQRAFTREGDAPAEAVGVEEALLLNRHAESCFAEDAAPAALWLQRAELLRRQRQTDKAAEAMEQARARRPITAEDHYLLARQHVAAGRHREALPLLHEAVRLDPRHFWAHFLLGGSHAELGDDVRAVTSYSVCIALTPGRYEAYFNRGLAALRQRDYAQARNDFTEVLRLQSNHVDALVNRGLAQQGLREPALAIEDFTAALDLGVTATRVYFLRARARDLIGDRDGAAKDREEGLRREPIEEKSWVARGIARMPTDPKAALADFERALELNPRSRSALMSKADVLAEHLGRTEASLTVLDRVLELYPDHAPAYAGRGVLHARLKNREAARRDGEAALSRYPTPLVRYQVACIHALTAENDEERRVAMKLLTEAVRLGFGGDLLKRDADLDPIRNLMEFKRLEQLVALQAAVSAR